VISGDGLPRLTRVKQRGIDILRLNGRFGNGIGSA